MIYTITLNPSLDYIVGVEHLVIGSVNRTQKELICPGGKGINVSLVLKNLGQETTALGFTAGFTGKEIERRLEDWGCHTDFTPLPEGMSRINIKLNAEQESEINGQGPEISEEAFEALCKKLDSMNASDLLVLGGSIGRGLPNNSYEKILERIQGKQVKAVVDATGELLLNTLKYHPFLIKPNTQELEELFQMPMEDETVIAECARRLQKMGAENVLVSRAGDGAILAGQDGILQILPAPKGKVVNSVGAGDSMVAGFLTGYLNTGSLAEAFRMGIAAGTASAFTERLADRAAVEVMLKQM